MSIIDEHTRECPTNLINRSVTGDVLINELDRLIALIEIPSDARRDQRDRSEIRHARRGTHRLDDGGSVTGVIIGIDPHKGSHTPFVLDREEKAERRGRRRRPRRTDSSREWHP